MKNKITIIIPYFKKKKYIDKCIKSILSQTFKSFVIIIIYDDTDLSELKFIEKYKKNKKIKVLVNKSKNHGAGPARNIALKHTKTKYIAFLDADDYWSKNKLQHQFNLMEKNNYEITHTNYFTIDEYGKIFGSSNLKDNITYNQLLKRCDIGLSSIMIKRQTLKKRIFGNTKTKEDYKLWLELSKNRIKFRLINKKLMYLRFSGNSLSSSNLQKIIDGFKIYYYYENFPLLKSLFFLFRLSILSLVKRILYLSN